MRLTYVAMPGPPTEPVSSGLQLRLLGAPRLELTGGGQHVLERRSAALLALLVLNGPTPRTRAAALVWPDVDDTHSNNSLRQRIFKLRQAAGHDVIVTDRFIGLAADIAHDLHAPLPRLAEDPESCRGELLGDLDFADCSELDEWVGLARRRWRGELASALADQASRLEHDGRVAVALRLAERLIELDPTAEHAHRRAMRLHYLRGDRAAALTAFDRCRSLLRADLGVVPDRETQELQQLIERADAPRALPPPAPSVAVLRPPRRVGRDAEWLYLQRAREAGRAVLVVGEAGIGKSRLLADFTAAHHGVVVRAHAGDANVPYASITRVLRAALERGGMPRDSAAAAELSRLLPELGPAARGPLELLPLRRAIEQCVDVAAGAGLAVVGVDDLQFADAASVELLLGLVARTPGTGWLLAARAAEMPAALRAWADAQDAETLTAVTLGPLDEAAVRALLASMALPGIDAGRWAAPLLRHTGGNPMFMLETLRSLLDRGLMADGGAPPAQLPLPADVGSLIERRLQRLGADALALARVAALAGQDFRPELAAAVLERRIVDLAEPWRELEAAQVIRDEAFAHDLILEATQRSVPQAIAKSLHRAIAARLQVMHAAPARLAEHWERGGENDAACTAYLAAAEAARARSRLDDELGLLARADACLGQADPGGRRCHVLHAAAVSTFELGRIHEMRRLVERLGATAAVPADRLLALDARLRLQAQELQFDAMLQTAAEAEPLADAVGSDFQKAFVRQLKANALSRSNRPEEALAALAYGFEWIEREPEHPWVSGFLVDAAATMSYLERYADSGRLARRAYDAAARIGHVRHMHMASANVAMIDYVLGDVAAAADEYERCRALAQRFGGDSLQTWMHGADLAFCLRLTGRFDEALVHALAHADRCRQAGVGEWWQVWADLELVRGFFELGQHARALSILGAKAPDNDDARFRWLMVRCRVQPADTAERRSWIDALRQLADGGVRSTGKKWTLAPDLCGVLPVDEAVDMVDRHVAACEAADARIYVPAMQLRLMQALLKAGRVAEAHARARRLVHDGNMPYGLYVPESWWIVHQVFDAAGDAPAAEAALAAGRRWIEQTALSHVPEVFRDSFLHRNAVNAALLAAARWPGDR